jgi:two-component system chemotaxis response regulator CheY
MDKMPDLHKSAQELPLILIVDDEAAIAETLAELISELGYTSLVAYNGQQALKLAREHWPTLVITDLMMPLLDGAHLVAELRAEASSRDLPVPPIIMLTAVGARAVNGVRVDVIMSKPFDLDKLEQVIQRLLAKH